MERAEPMTDSVASPSGGGAFHIEFLDRFSRANTNSFRASLLLSSLLVFGLWGYLPHTALLTWLFTVWGVQTAHEAYSRYYRKHRGNGPDEYRRWVPGFWLGAAVVGACWSLPFFLLDFITYDAVLLLAFAIAGVTAYGGVARATVLSVALIFEFAAVLPLCVWLFRQDSHIHHIMGAAALLYLAMLTPLLRKMNQMVTRTLLLDGENHRLSDEQKRHLERLHSSEEEYRTLAENLPVAVIRYDAEQRRCYINPAAERMLHGTTMQMLGLVPGEGGVPATPAMIERYRSKMTEVMASGETREFEFVLDALPQVEQKQYEVRMAPEYSANGKIAGALAIWFDITERKRMEEELRLKEHVLDQAQEGVYLIDEQARFVYVNDEACRSLGYSRDELLGMVVQDIDHAYSVEATNAIGQKSREEGSFAFETQHRRRDGSLFPVEIQASASVYQGKHLGLAMARDISERKQAELALEKSNALLRSVLQGIPDPVWMKDADGTFVVCNQGVARSLNQPIEEIIGKNDYDFFPPDRAALYQNKDRAVLEAGRILIEEEWWTFGDNGEQALMETCKTPVRSLDGKLLGVLGVARNITERKAVQRQLEMLHLAINQISDALFVQDDSLRFIAVNDAACRSLGYSREELTKMSTPDIDPGFTREKVVRAFVTAELEKPVCFESRHRTKDGRNIPVEITGTFFEIDGVRHVVAVARDITERKRIEAALDERQRAFSSLAENIPDNVVRWDTEGRYLYVNPAHERVLGKRLADLVGSRIPDSHEQVKAAIAQVVSTGQMVHAVRQPVVVEGVEELHDVNLVPEFGESGEIVSVLALGRNMTERYRLLEKIAAREQEFRSLAESSPDYIIRYDREGRTLYLNGPLVRVLGLNSVNDVLGFRPSETWPDGRYDAIEQAAARAVETGEEQRFEMTGPRLNGELGFNQIFVVPERGVNGDIVGTIAVGRDISDIRLSEARLANERATLRAFFGAMPNLAWMKDAEGRYLACNPMFEQFYGASEALIVGKTDFDFVDADLAAFFRQMDKEAEAAGEPCVNEEWVTFASDGRRALLETVKAPVADAEGKVIGVIGVARDITERKQAEALLLERYEHIVELNASLQENACTLEEQAVELEASKEQLMLTEAWYRGILQSAPDGMVVVDARGVIRLVNARLCHMFGYEDRELVGQTIELLVPVEMRNAHKTLRAGFIESGSPGRPMASGRGGLSASRKDGSEFFVDVSLARLPEMDGAMGTVCAAIRDVTEQKLMERTLAKREQEFRTLVENAVDTVARYGRDLRRMYVNPAFAALVDGGAAALLGRTPSECPGGPNAVTYESKLAEVFVEGRGAGFELKWRDSSGREMCSLVNLSPEFDVNGQVVSVLAVGRDITELNAYRHKIHQMAFYDPLTALPNRALFNDRLRQMITDAAWHGQQAGLMMMDMDRFKEVNDTLGHAAGDELLRDAAARLSTCVRAYDTVARLGGDEFAILLPEVRSGDDLGGVASKILALFQQPFLLDGKEVFVSCSIGIALYPGDSTEADDLLKYADSAMYFAKRSGRNNFRFYSRDLTESSHERLVLESDLRRAIERDELELYYQPKVGLCDGALTGSEALLRWKHPERGMVPPDVFIGIAEDSGLIGEIGEWVLHEACRTAHRWNGKGKPPHKVAINLSARQFQGGDLVETVCRALEGSACQPEWIELEITESLLLGDDSDVLEVLNRLRSMGISIAIDDFGTGYSALSYLARFPIGTLKIDRSFISSIETDTYRAELVKAILSIARCLGQQVVAEGVETEAQIEFLRAHGCHLAQGYFYGKPMPVTDFERLPQSFDRA